MDPSLAASILAELDSIPVEQWDSVPLSDAEWSALADLLEDDCLQTSLDKWAALLKRVDPVEYREPPLPPTPMPFFITHQARVETYFLRANHVSLFHPCDPVHPPADNEAEVKVSAVSEREVEGGKKRARLRNGRVNPNETITSTEETC